MGKELVISANRHETKVAILEDDQLVEVYFQRANEYSLAGSIHKGRVTRVLPGMQSAFVDIGLERDAFLYVSDFFEDNEEYDKIASAAEEKVLKADRNAPRGAERPPAPPPVEAAVERPVEAIPVEAAPAAEPGTRPAERMVHERVEDGENRDRRGRRSRRRRQRGRGFPESKYASLREEPAPAEPVSAPDAGDFAVLPGESLAKYSHEESENPELPESAPEAFEPVAATEAAPYQAIEVEEETEIEPVSPEELSEFAPAETAAEPQDEVPASASLVEEPAPEPLVEEPAAFVAKDAAEVENCAVEMDAGPAIESEIEEIPELTELAEGAIPEEPETAEAAEGTAIEEREAEPTTEGALEPVAEEVEPARMPVSLTATLREQGHRYMQQRVSRRARRKMRGGGFERPQQEQRPEPPVEPAPAPAPAPAEEQVNGRAASARAERPPQQSISELLREGQEILVQIAKEPLGQKGARITSHIALPGRFVVYTPTVEHLGVSRKISSDEERLRLKRILHAHRAGMTGGFIVRTAGEGKSEEEIASDMRFLYNMWLDIRQKAEARRAPALLHHDLDVVNRILRDQMTDTFKTIWVDNEQLYESVLRFVERFQPAAVARVKLYTRDMPIFDAFNITAELEKALRPKVWLKSGGYIVINQTEALVAIDVNTGKFVGKSNRLEDTIVKTNTEAVKEIVRQVRLRDLGGIIVVDFIDMDERKNRQKVMQALEEAMCADRAPNKILQFNDFGLVAITRKRVKQSLERTLCSPCPYCEGAGYVKSVQTIIGEILQEAQKIAKLVESTDVTLRVNPEVAKVFKSSKNSFLEELEEVLGRPVLVKSDALLQQEKFDLI
jgi:ribonuclease G